MVCRNPERGEGARQELIKVTGNERIPVSYDTNLQRKLYDQSLAWTGLAPKEYSVHI